MCHVHLQSVYFAVVGWSVRSGWSMGAAQLLCILADFLETHSVTERAVLKSPAVITR